MRTIAYFPILFFFIILIFMIFSAIEMDVEEKYIKDSNKKAEKREMLNEGR